MTDSNLMIKKEENTVSDNPPTPVLRRDELMTGENNLDPINNFYLNDEEEKYIKEPSITEQAFKQVGGLGLEIGTGITTDYLTAPLLVAPVPGSRVAYGVINFGSGYTSNLAAQKIRGEKNISQGEAIMAGFTQMIPFGSTGKGVKGLTGAGLQGAATATTETTGRTLIDEQKLPTAEELGTSATLGTVLGTGFKGSIDFLKSLSKKFQGKSAAEIDSLITNEDKSRLEELLKNADSDEAKKIARGIREGDIGYTDEDGLIDQIVDGATYEQLINTKLQPFQDLETGGIGKKRRGAEYLKKRILKQFPVKGADPEDAEMTVKFIDKFANRLDDVSISVTNKIGPQGRYNFATNLIQIRQKTIDEGQLTDTMIHELWHSLSRYLPKKDLAKLTKDFQVEKLDYLTNLNKKIKDKNLSKKELVRYTNELNKFKKGTGYTADNYRFKDIDEFFAENLKDISLERLDDDLDLAPSGTWKRITQEVSLFIRDLFVSLKAKLGGPQSQRIYNDFLKNKNLVKQRKGPLESPVDFDEYLEEGIEDMAGQIRQAKAEFKTQQKGNDFERSTKDLPDLPGKKKKKGPLEGTDTTPHQVNPEQVSNTSGQFNFIVNRIKQLKDSGAFSSVKTTEDTIDGGIRMLSNTNKLKSHAQMYAKIYGLVPTDELNYALAEAVTLSTQKTADINQKLIDAINVSKDPVLIEQNINEIIESIGEIDEWLRLGIPLRTEQGRGLRSMQIPTQGVSPEEFAKMTPAEKYKLNRTGQSTISIKESEQSLKLEELKTNLLDAFEVAKQTGDYTALNKLTNTIKRADGNVEKISALYETTLLHKTLSSFNKANRIFNEIGINALLSAPTTNEINFLSGVLETFMSSYELIRGAGSRTELDAAIRHLIALKSNTSFARKAFTQSFKTSDNWINRGALKADYQEKFVISSEGKDILSRVYDGSGKVIRFPSQLMTSVDALVQAPNLIASVHYQGHMEGTKLGLKGKELDNYIKGHLDAILEYYASNSGKGIKDKVTARILKRSQEFAKRSTFTEDIRADGYVDFGKAAKLVNSAAGQIPMVRTLLSFIRAPTNIIKRQLRRTPVLNKALKELAVDLESTDPIVRNQARGQMKVAKDLGITVAALTGAGILMQQDPNFVPPIILTGGGPDWKTKEGRAVWKSMLKNGWLPYSVGILQKNEVGQPLIGDDGKPVYKYYSYERLDPLSSWIGLMVDSVVVSGFLTDDEYDEFTVGWMGAFTRNLFDRSYLQQIDDAMKALTDERGGTSRENFWSRQLASRFFYGNFNRYAKQLPGDLLDMVGVSKEDSARFHQKRDTKVRAGDYWNEEKNEKMEEVRALRKLLNQYSETVPGMGGNLPFLHEHITNEPILYPQRPGPDLFSWIKTSTSKNHPLWTALGTIGKELREPSDVITGSASSKRVEPFRLTTTEYAELREIINTIESKDGKNIDQTIREYLKSDHYKKNIALVKKNGALNEVIGVNKIYSKLQEFNNAFIEAGENEWIRRQGSKRQQEQIDKKKGIIDKYIEEIKALPN